MKMKITIRPSPLQNGYVVVKAVNTLDPKVGQCLKSQEVQQFMSDGIEVTVLEKK